MSIGNGVDREKKLELSDSLLQLSSALPMYTTGREARKRISRLLRASGSSIEDLRSLWADPCFHFGPFEELPESARSAFGTAAYWYFQEQNLITSERLFGLVHGRTFGFGTRLAGWSWRKQFQFRRRKVLRGTARVAYLAGRVLTAAHRLLGRAWIKATRFTRFSRAPFIHTVWMYADVNPRDLIQSYIDEIPLEPRLTPVFSRNNAKVASCALVGLDLLISEGRVYYLEANFNPGMHESDLAIYPCGHPVGQGLLDYAASGGFSHVVYYPYIFKALLPAAFEAQWRELAGRFGLSLEIRDNPLVGTRLDRSTDLLMDINAEGTLYVNGRGLHSPLSLLIREKGRLEREIRRANSVQPSHRRISLPRMIRSAFDLAACKPPSRFPNLIVKTATEDMGRGITLYKTDRLPPGATDWPKIAFEYVVPDRQKNVSGGFPQETVTKFRSYLLLTPEGPLYVGTRKSTAAKPIPDHLPAGRVADLVPYICSSSLRSIPHAPSEFEEERIKPVVLRIGAIVTDYLNRKHDIVIDGGRGFEADSAEAGLAAAAL